jgi:Family of unknown function (DUF5677)
MNDDLSVEDLLNKIEERMRYELRLRCESFVPNFEKPQVFSVLTALLARQTTLALELSSAPQLWNSHSAPLFLRAMADVHITLAWILLEPEARAQQYIEHGLGQAVLDMEHRKKRMDSEDETRKAELQTHIDGLRSWIDMQRLNFIVEVNVGAWSGKTTREMAEQAGLLEFYSYVYSPFSQCAHSTWYHVGQLNSGLSDSPYTRLLWVPQIAESGTDPWNLILAAKYLDKSFNAFDEKALGHPATSDIQTWISDILAKDPDDEEVGDSFQN